MSGKLMHWTRGGVNPATHFVLRFVWAVNRLGTIRGGQFHVGAHRWPRELHLRVSEPVDLFTSPWEVDISRRTSLDSRCRYGYWKASRRPLHPVSRAAAGWLASSGGL